MLKFIVSTVSLFGAATLAFGGGKATTGKDIEPVGTKTEVAAKPAEGKIAASVKVEAGKLEVVAKPAESKKTEVAAKPAESMKTEVAAKPAESKKAEVAAKPAESKTETAESNKSGKRDLMEDVKTLKDSDKTTPTNVALVEGETAKELAKEVDKIAMEIREESGESIVGKSK